MVSGEGESRSANRSWTALNISGVLEGRVSWPSPSQLGHCIVQHAEGGPQKQTRDADAYEDIRPQTLKSSNQDRRHDDGTVCHQGAVRGQLSK